MRSVKHGARFSPTAMFYRYRTYVACDGKESEFILFTRIGRGTKRFLVGHVRWGLLDADSNLVPGDIVLDEQGNKYFLVAKADSMQGDKAEFYQTNCKATIVRPTKAYNDYDEPIGFNKEVLYEDYDCVYEDVSQFMHLYDYGLLPSTTRRFILPKDAKVKKLDRITVKGVHMQIDNINYSDFDPFLYVQCSNDERVFGTDGEETEEVSDG